MQEDIKVLAQDVLNKTQVGLLKIAVDGSAEVIEAVNQYIGDAQERFANLFQHIAEGGDAKFFIERISEEKDILKSSILSFVVIGKGIAERVINSVQDIILDALAKVLSKVE